MAKKDLIVVIAGDNTDLLKKLRQVKRDFTNLGRDLSAVGRGLTASITVPLGLAGGAALKLAADFEQAQVSFETMLGSAEKAASFLKDLEDFAKSTPFDFPGLVKGARRLIAMGFEAERVIPILTTVGDAAAAMGVGAEGVDRITLALSQMRAKGKVSSEEMTRQLGQIIPAWEMLAEEIGVSVPEAMKLAENGMLDGAAAVDAILTGMSRRFAGGMEAQMQTLVGLFDRAKDTALIALRSIGTALLPLAKQIFKNVFLPLVNGIEAVAAIFTSLSSSTQATIAMFAGLAAAMGPALMVAGAIATAVAGIMFIGAQAASVIAGLVVAFAAVGAAAILFRDQIAKAWEKAAEFAVSVAPQILSALNTLVNTWNAAWAAMKLAALLFVDGLVALWNSGLFDVLLGPFKAFIDRAIFGFTLLLKVGGMVVDFLVGKFEEFAKVLAKMPGAIGDAAREFLSAMNDWRAGTDQVGAAIAKMGGFVKDAKDAANSLTKGIKAGLPALGSFSNVIKESGDKSKAAAKEIWTLGDAWNEGRDAFAAFGKELVGGTDKFKALKDVTDQVVGKTSEYNTELLEMVQNLNPIGNLLKGISVETVKAADAGREFTEAFEKDLENVDKIKDRITEINKKLQEANLTQEERLILQKQLNEATDSYNSALGLQEKINERLKQLWTDIEGAVRNFGFALSDALINGTDLGEALITMMKDLATAILDYVIQGAIDAFKESIVDLVAKTDLLTAAWAKFFGTMGVQGAAGGAGGAAGGAAGAAGEAAGGLAGVIGVITSIANLVVSIFQSFQFAAMNKTLDLIETEVRESKIHLSYILEAIHTYLATDAWNRFDQTKTHWAEQIAKYDMLDESIRAVESAVKGIVVGPLGPGVPYNPYISNQPAAPTEVDWGENTRTLFTERGDYLIDALRYPLDLIAKGLNSLEFNTIRDLIIPRLDRMIDIQTGILIGIGGDPENTGKYVPLVAGASLGGGGGLTVNLNGPMRQGEITQRLQQEMEAFGIPH